MPDLLDLESYDYPLPPELIAQAPLAERSSSRLLHLDRRSGSLAHRHFGDLVGLMEPGEVLVVNNSKVIPARLFGRKSNGTQIEILLLNKLSCAQWKCMVHHGKRLKTAQWLDFSPILRGWVSLPDAEGLREIEFFSSGDYWQEIKRVGHTPLPPYIKRQDDSGDRSRYQTVYAEEPGSVAAPTAGLHFSADILDALKAKGVLICNVILHVGMGTFLPIKSPRIDQHKMHSEFCTLPFDTAQAVNAAREKGKRVIAVGTTSIRTLESFWSGGQVHAGSHWTDIFIYPGRELHVADALITNFHLPKSSLLMLVSAFAEFALVRQAYQEAVRERYRFFSYGDAMLIT